MYVKIHGTKDYVKGNTQSCRDLAEYLEKENEDKLIPDQEQFFNQESKTINKELVVNSIDNNKKGLKDKDAKFFMVTVNPSQKELRHLAKMATGGKKIKNISEMTPVELGKYNNMVKDYANKVMDDYAKAFNRGIEGKDLVYYGKLEQERTYKGTEQDVKEGKAKSGDLKEGLQTHVHIIVSRKDKTQKLSLSPLANSKGSKNKLNGKEVKIGFNRDEFAQTCESEFDKMYNYNRDLQETYVYNKFSQDPLSGLAQTVNAPFQLLNKLENPEESIKNALVNQLQNTLSKLLPPEVQAAKKVIEKAAKILELGSGLDI